MLERNADTYGHLTKCKRLTSISINTVSNNGVSFFLVEIFCSWIVLWVYIRIIKCSWIQRRTHTHTITPLRFRAENPYLASIKINERYLRPGILLRSFILFKSLNSDKEVSVTISKLHSIKVWSVWISWFIVADPKLVNFYCLFFLKSYIYTESIKMPGRPLWQVRVACFSHNFP